MTEIIYTPIPELAKPVTIITELETRSLENRLIDAGLIEITNNQQKKEAAEIMGALNNLSRLFKDRALELGRPFREEAERISLEAKPSIDRAKEAAEKLGKAIKSFEQQEETRLAQEAAEVARLEAKVLQDKKDAEGKLINAKSAEEMEAARVQFLQAESTKKQLAEVKPEGEKIKVKGLRTVRKPEIISVEISKAPLNFLVPDEVKIKKAILAGLIEPDAPWIKFRVTETYTSSGK